MMYDYYLSFLKQFFIISPHLIIVTCTFTTKDLICHFSLLSQQHQELLNLAATKITNLKKANLDDKFIICLNKVSKHFPPFMDR